LVVELPLFERVLYISGGYGIFVPSTVSSSKAFGKDSAFPDGLDDPTHG